MWKIGIVRGYNRGWTSDIYTEKTPDFKRFKYSFNKRSLRLFLLYPWKNEKFNQNIILWTITLITPLFGIVHFKTNYNYRLSNHCFINELILVTYALISNAVEKTSWNEPKWIKIDRKSGFRSVRSFAIVIRRAYFEAKKHRKYAKNVVVNGSVNTSAVFWDQAYMFLQWNIML